jgi:hypothetical protein
MKSWLQRAWLAASLIASPAWAVAQSASSHQFEISVMTAVTVITEDVDSYYSYDSDTEESETYVRVPVGAPGLRVTFWTGTPVTVEAGLKLDLAISDDGTGENVMAEVGVGIDLRDRTQALRPYVAVLGGLLMFNDDVSRNYLGAQAGVRYFIREYAALKIQLGHRTTMRDLGHDYRASELAFGLGFQL